MPILFKTNNINKVAYTKIIRRYVCLIESVSFWQAFNEKVDIHIIPVEDSDKYREFYKHVKLETSSGMAWGVNMPKTTHSKATIYCFIIDTKNPFIIRSNARIIIHELAHQIRAITHKGKRVKRKYDSPEAKAGTISSAHTALVHDVYYGSKKQIRYWIRYGVMWLPISGIDIR